MNYEYCIKCDCETGRAGAGEDSIYLEDGSGPYCERCWKKAAPENDALDRLACDVRNNYLPGGLLADVKVALELAEIGLKWRTDSSLEKWFPFTARELAELQQYRKLIREECGTDDIAVIAGLVKEARAHSANAELRDAPPATPESK